MLFNRLWGIVVLAKTERKKEKDTTLKGCTEPTETHDSFLISSFFHQSSHYFAECSWTRRDKTWNFKTKPNFAWIPQLKVKLCQRKRQKCKIQPAESVPIVNKRRVYWPGHQITWYCIDPLWAELECICHRNKLPGINFGQMYETNIIKNQTIQTQTEAANCVSAAQFCSCGTWWYPPTIWETRTDVLHSLCGQR